MAGREGALVERQLGMRFVDKVVHEAEVRWALAMTRGWAGSQMGFATGERVDAGRWWAGSKVVWDG